MIDIKTAKRFWSKVDIGGVGDCWQWREGLITWGYGGFHFQGRSHAAHRIAYASAYGDIRPGLCVLHHCDNPPCCNPSHLFLGTHTDNVKDMDRKGRRGKVIKGERHHSAKLTGAEVKAIREFQPQKRGDIVELARKYNVGDSLISMIRKGYRRPHG